MIGAIYGGPIAGYVLETGDAVSDAAQRESEPHADVSQYVEVLLGSEEMRDQHSRRRDDEDVEGDEDEGRHRPEGRDDHAPR